MTDGTYAALLKELEQQKKTLRDTFACAALTGLVTMRLSETEPEKQAAKIAYKIADSMLEERERK